VMSTWRALSFRQPWLWMVLEGLKPIENREQWMYHRGPIILHASKSMSERYHASALTFVDRAFGHELLRDLPDVDGFRRGGFCGIATIVGAIRGGEEKPSGDADLYERTVSIVSRDAPNHVTFSRGGASWDLRWRMPSTKAKALQHAYLLAGVRELPFVEGPGKLGLFRVAPAIVARLGLPPTPEDWTAGERYSELWAGAR
jgi:hypothetical protein